MPNSLKYSIFYYSRKKSKPLSYLPLYPILYHCYYIKVAGDDFLTLPIMSLGGKGVISVTANIAPKPMCEMVNAMLKGEVEKAKEITIRLFSLFEAMFLETNPIPVKKAAEMMGLSSGHVRLPLAALSAENEGKLRRVLEGLEMVGKGR